MANHIVNTSAKEERGLQYQLVAWNAELAKQNPPPAAWSADQLFQELCKPLLDSLRAQGVEVAGKDIRTALNTALETGDTAKINAVKAALGLP